MDLSSEQQQAIAAWVNAGGTPATVQQQLQDEFGIKMTFMEVRFLIDDLDLSIVEPTKPEPENDEPVPFPGGEARDAHATLEPGSGKVTVSVDVIQRPGALVSGNVTFSDGETMDWQLDQMGRLGLIPGREGYQPSPEDIQDFQAALQDELRKKGFA